MTTEHKVVNVHKLVETLLELTKEGYTYVPESVKQLGTRFRFAVEKEEKVVIDLSLPDEISEIGQGIQPDVSIPPESETIEFVNFPEKEETPAPVEEEKTKKPRKPRAKKTTTKK